MRLSRVLLKLCGLEESSSRTAQPPSGELAGALHGPAQGMWVADGCTAENSSAYRPLPACFPPRGAGSDPQAHSSSLDASGKLGVQLVPLGSQHHWISSVIFGLW